MRVVFSFLRLFIPYLHTVFIDADDSVEQTDLSSKSFPNASLKSLKSLNKAGLITFKNITCCYLHYVICNVLFYRLMLA